MKWVTRHHVHVDRVACPWLIRKFVDPDAELLFVPPDEVMSVAEREGAIPFDARGQAELDHHEGRCSFESIIKKYGLTDPALNEVARIVHAADVAADRDTAPEAAGLEAIARGFGLLPHADDHEILEKQFPVYDALYAYCQARLNQ
ncbi:MAG TPA: chromate resistance protein ChrB domain-containing protein [Dehalococcoidales bacterium]|nr:chromate resistance protein ChrB domain-containing protein [Dehalococcoidales bacterium]